MCKPIFIFSELIFLGGDGHMPITKLQRHVSPLPYSQEFIGNKCMTLVLTLNMAYVHLPARTTSTYVH